MSEETDGPDVIWALLEAAAKLHEASLNRILAAVRRTQSIPMRAVAPEIPRVASILQQAEDVDYEGLWQGEIIDRLRTIHSTFEFLSSWSKTIRPMGAGDAREVMALRPIGDDPSIRIESCRRRVELLLLSRPSGKEFWDFARVIRDDIQDEIDTARGANLTLLVRYRYTIGSVVPSWVFEDDSPGANSRYSYRPITVKRIVSGGLPGQGKRV